MTHNGVWNTQISVPARPKPPTSHTTMMHASAATVARASLFACRIAWAYVRISLWDTALPLPAKLL